MATINEIIQNIIAQAKILDPAISLEVGTPERKIIEAVAEQIASAQVDIAVLSQQHDIDQLTGIRLDAFMNNFGFARQLSTRSNGTVTISRNTPGIANTTIPRGTQFISPATGNTPVLVFTSLQTVVIRPNDLTYDIAVECVTPGTIGNIPSGSITAFTSSNTPGNFPYVINQNPLNGGRDGETDETLKVRFKNSAFRHISGTTDSYLALAVAQPSVTKANVIGPQSRYIEYIQIPQNRDSQQVREFDPSGQRFPNKLTTTVSTVPYSKYTYSTGYYIQNEATKDFLKANKDYVFNIPAWADGDSSGVSPLTVEPNVTILNPTPSGTDPNTFDQDVLLFEHLYISKASRNDWNNRITNCVDIYINGAEEVQADNTEEPLPTVAEQFSNDVSSPYYYKNFRRVDTHGDPKMSPASYLQVLYWQPVTSVPDTIEVGDIVFNKNVDYFQIEDISVNRATVRARNGIEWLPEALSKINTTSIPMVYSYDSNIEMLQSVVERNKQITTDALVHKAKIRYLKLYLTIMYAPNTTPENINKDIYKGLQAFLDGQYFGSAVQLSDILQAVHNVSGVDNVRWTYDNQQDLNIYKNKIEFVTSSGASFANREFEYRDFFLQDDELASLPGDNNNVNVALEIVTKAQNTWNR
jgi:uncharacterized phage protein gp47/JayE